MASKHDPRYTFPKEFLTGKVIDSKGKAVYTLLTKSKDSKPHTTTIKRSDGGYVAKIRWGRAGTVKIAKTTIALSDFVRDRCTTGVSGVCSGHK
ncbi:hypothetical protein FRC05_000355 [Tulasnella sp. 425]|nr:hypothetical protein FRC05_000355 [Tulasnella sp. 425]